MGITCGCAGPLVDLGLTRVGLAARSTRALVGRTAAFGGSAARTRSGSGTSASAACCRSARARAVMGRTGCARAFVGRARAGCGSIAGRACETGLPNGALVEPAGSCMGPTQGRRRGAAATVWERLGSASGLGRRATANCRAVLGGARRPGCAKVRFLERAGRAGLGHAEDRRARCPGRPFVGSAGRASG